MVFFNWKRTRRAQLTLSHHQCAIANFMYEYFSLISVQLDNHCCAKTWINTWKPCPVSCRLRLARARDALEYYSFFHSATYTLKHPKPTQDQSSKLQIPEATPPLQNVTEVTPTIIVPLPPPPRDPPPPVIPPPSLPPAPPVLGLPFSLPLIEATPPSPHLSWGACSDADVYSRIGGSRPSRLSSLSNQSKVILFEHSSLWARLHGAKDVQMKWKSCTRVFICMVVIC